MCCRKYCSLFAMSLMSSWCAVLAIDTSSTSTSTNSGSRITPTTSSSEIPSPSGVLYDTQHSFWFPIIGLSDDISVPWGVNISTLKINVWANGDVCPNFEVYKIVVNDTNPVPSAAPELGGPPYENQSPQVVAISDDTHDRQGSLVVTTNGDPILVLGLNSYLNYTRLVNYDDLIIPTVPFGLNYGHHGVWNGSIALGGVYDANRVAFSSWTLIAESAAGNSLFLQNGTLETTASLELQDVVITFPTILDTNQEALILPSSFACSQALTENLIIGISSPNLPDSVLKIVVPSDLTSTPNRCTNLKSDDPNNNKIILGRPFFQASYIFVGRDGHVFITAAHQYDLNIMTQKFYENVTLYPVQEPTQPTNSSSPTGGHKSTDSRGITHPLQIQTLGIGWSLALFALVAALVPIVL